MDNLAPILYHLSTSNIPEQQEKGGYLVTTAPFIFKHWKESNSTFRVFESWKEGPVYLHHVTCSGRCLEFHEDSHNDIVSSITFDEYGIEESVDSVQSWNLSDLNEVEQLFDSDFDGRSGRALFSDSTDFLVTVILALPQSDIVPWAEQSEIAETRKLSSIKFASERAFIKVVSVIDVDPTVLYQLIKVDTEWSSLVGLSDSDLAKAFDNKSRYSVLSESRHVVDWCLSDSFTSRLARYPLLTQRLFDWQLVVDLESATRPILDDVELFVTSELLVCMLRLGRTAQIIDCLERNPNLSLPSCSGELIAACVIYQDHVMLEYLVKQGFLKQKEFAYQIASICLSAHGSYFADSAVPLPSVTDLMSWQSEQSIGDLKQAVSKGLSLRCHALLESGGIDQRELDAAIVLAAENGFTELLKLLYDYGASLSAGGYWPIKYANKFGHLAMRDFLLSKGQPNKSFN
ncbi:hypothetical protein J4N42_06170 [Vibrio sp. SCSIO 43135]|uniref:Ankyrin repeat domain-containing protein n=1 Tax=Vibrio paucivorans TaxID=2829489 RepID=A0A9X3CGI3_9VIBR|nr:MULTISPECIES: ankyrin repeat domain-containing protein [Vibrio]MCW8335024.1 ankyrin repeat domain-containing protein [Vibrio paucivorans]USD42303.1 hypothetical protein J4N42_06170 [Vibrio sp. SCSIO 43135]